MSEITTRKRYSNTGWTSDIVPAVQVPGFPGKKNAAQLSEGEELQTAQLGVPGGKNIQLSFVCLGGNQSGVGGGFQEEEVAELRETMTGC